MATGFEVLNYLGYEVNEHVLFGYSRQIQKEAIKHFLKNPVKFSPNVTVTDIQNFFKDVLTKALLFEINDSRTRGVAELLIKIYLDYAFELNYGVVCNEINNTPESIDNHELWLEYMCFVENSFNRSVIFIGPMEMNTFNELFTRQV